MSWTLDTEQPFGPRHVARRYRLPSGLRLILVADDSAPIVSYQTWFGVGSRHEKPNATGMAHLFEHLMFNQTETLAPGEFDRLIERTGGDSNAGTWVDGTYYRDSVPATDLDLVARLEADRMQHLVLDTEQLECEREVVANERLERVDDDVDGFLDEELNRLAFRLHPYRWPTIGWMQDIRSLSLPDVRAFYRTYYAPNNACIIIVGDVDESATLELLARHYGPIPAADIAPEPAVAEPEQTEARRREFTKPVVAPRVLQGYKSPGQEHGDWIVLELICALLTLGPSSRLYRRLVIDRELATTADSAIAPFRHPCLFRISVNAIRGCSTQAIEHEIEDVLSAVREQDVDPDELEKARSGAETEFWAELESFDGKAEALGHFEMVNGDFRLLFEAADRLRRIDAADVRRVASAYLTPERCSTVLAIPKETA